MFTPRYSWNNANDGVKHQPINQSFFPQSTLELYCFHRWYTAFIGDTSDLCCKLQQLLTIYIVHTTKTTIVWLINMLCVFPLINYRYKCILSIFSFGQSTLGGWYRNCRGVSSNLVSVKCPWFYNGRILSKVYDLVDETIYKVTNQNIHDVLEGIQK